MKALIQTYRGECQIPLEVPRKKKNIKTACQEELTGMEENF